MLYKFYAGVGVGNWPAHFKTNQLALALFGGFSASAVDGGWVTPDGTTYVEQAVMYEIVTDDAEKANQFAHALQVAFKQDAVLVVAVPAESWLVGGKV